MTGTDLQTTLAGVARLFRLGMEADASEQLQQLVDLVTPVLGQTDAETLNALVPRLQQLADAQQRKDMSRAADLLEFEIAPVLRTAARPQRST